MDEVTMLETPSVDLQGMSHDIEARDQIPHPLCMGIKFSTPGKAKRSNAPDMLGGGGGDVEASIWPV